MSDITIAASAAAFVKLFNVIRDNFTFAKSDTKTFGPFSASYSIKLHLSGGTVQLNNDDTVEVKNLDIVFDTLTVNVCLDLPGFCIGGWCIVPDPWNGCLVGVPKICIGGPICIAPDLSGLVSQLSDFKAKLKPVYYVDPARLPAWTDLDAELNGHPNQWQIFLDPVYVLVDPIDLPATIENIIENLVKDAIESLFPSWLPGWAVDLLVAALGPVIDLIKSALGVVSDFTGFLFNLINNLLAFPALIETAVADHFASQSPLYEFTDPYPMLPGSGGLIPVIIPIINLAAHVDSAEMIVTADVGA